ncbi:tail assembly protein [Candidatus Pantoea multigeneris]|uniref:Tail assembly protein n=1 Tax=Candidatus Pantoea multigeneris TaxID=2608357 RepID=A0ABX0R589_9GAMM|nr:tail assembly protein [Pantoea multigeneris]NIF20571.1 tail assembly protein [Pantoea multigeneris]
MLKTLTLGGALAKKFGKTHRYQVADLREMLRAMCTTVPGFKKYVSNAHLNGIRFAFYSDKHNITLPEFDMSNGANEYRMVSVIEGSKSAGLLQIVIGSAALVAAFFTAGASLGVWGATLGVGTGAAALTGGAALAATALTGMGLSMMLGGVVGLLTPQPGYSVGSSSSADNKPNYAFGSPVNTVAMGYPVPVAYGERENGGAIISAGIFSSDQQ